MDGSGACARSALCFVQPVSMSDTNVIWVHLTIWRRSSMPCTHALQHRGIWVHSHKFGMHKWCVREQERERQSEWTESQKPIRIKWRKMKETKHVRRIWSPDFFKRFHMACCVVYSILYWLEWHTGIPIRTASRDEKLTSKINLKKKKTNE